MFTVVAQKLSTYTWGGGVTESTISVQLLYLLFITLFQLLWQLHIWKAESLLLPLTSSYIRIMVCLLCDMQPFCLLFLKFIRSLHSKRYSFMTVQFTGTRSTKRINTTKKLLGFMSSCVLWQNKCSLYRKVMSLFF